MNGGVSFANDNADRLTSVPGKYGGVKVDAVATDIVIAVDAPVPIDG
jgi:hypothetical protein